MNYFKLILLLFISIPVYAQELIFKLVSFGMSLTEQRIQTLESTSQKKFDTRIVDLEDEQGNPLGTEVHLIIPLDN